MKKKLLFSFITAAFALPHSLEAHPAFASALFLQKQAASYDLVLNNSIENGFPDDAAKKASVAIVYSARLDPYALAAGGLQQAIKSYGIVPAVVEYDLSRDGPQSIIQKILKERPSFILTLGTPALNAVKKGIEDIPIVFCMVLNPPALTQSNVTGVVMDISPQIKIQNFKRIFPNMKTLGLIQKRGLPADAHFFNAAEKNGLTLIRNEVDSESDLPEAIEELSFRVDALMMVPDASIYSAKSVEYLLLQSLKSKFAVIGLSSLYTKAGALLSFDCDYKDLGRQCGETAMKILSGEKPQNLGIEAPRKIDFSINLNTANRLNIEIPELVVKEASQVFGR